MTMKINLVVASGVHQGKTIAVPGEKFVIGRDPACQLRPASQLVSKQHCAILVQNGRVMLQDFGSTNGTFVNDEQLVANSIIELRVGDRLKVGPLDFSVQYTGGRTSDSTPMPDQLKAVSAPAIDKLRQAAGKSSPAMSSVSPSKKSDPQTKPATAATGNDDIAAMLLGMDDDGPAAVPEGSTIMEMPAVIAGAGDASKEADKKKAAIPTREDSSNAASDILKKMMRRTR